MKISKFIILSIFLFSSFLPNLYSQNDKSIEEDYLETALWIKSKLQDGIVFHSANDNMGYGILEVLIDENCNCQLITGMVKYRFNFSTISYGSVEKFESSVLLTSFLKLKTIEYTWWDDSVTNNSMIRIHGDIEGERLAKAMVHIIKLCDGKDDTVEKF